MGEKTIRQPTGFRKQQVPPLRGGCKDLKLD
jgi:hypothetical protein